MRGCPGSTRASWLPIFEQPYCRIGDPVGKGSAQRQAASRYLHDLAPWVRCRLRPRLLRLWLAVPDSQPLPAWAEYFIDTRPGSVRGGPRGPNSTAEFADYEKRQAAALGMAYRPWAPVKRRQDVPAEVRAARTPLSGRHLRPRASGKRPVLDRDDIGALARRANAARPSQRGPALPT